MSATSANFLARAFQVACVLFSLHFFTNAQAAPIFFDSFEGGVNHTIWQKEEYPHHWLEGEPNFGHSGRDCARAWMNWRIPYDMWHDLTPLQLVNEDFYLSCWVYEDVGNPPGLPAPPFDRYWSEEHEANALIGLCNLGGEDDFRFGLNGRIKFAKDPQWPENVYFTTYTISSGWQLLLGTPEWPLPVPRLPGWRKWMIRVKPYSQTQNDVAFYLDGQLVGTAKRYPGAGEGSIIERIWIGSPWLWTGETFWYDDVELDYWPNPTTSPSIAGALAEEPDTWVRLADVSVTEAGVDFIRVADMTGSALVTPSRFGAPGDVVSIIGRVRESLGHRYIDAYEVNIVTPAPMRQPESIAEARGYPDGTWVQLPESVVSAAWVNHKFIEQPDRAAGLEMRGAIMPKLADSIRVTGRMVTVNGARMIDAYSIETVSAGNPLPNPLGASGRSLRLSAPAPEGMVVTTWGKVVRVSQAWCPDWAEVDDGSTGPDEPYVRIKLSDYQQAPPVGAFVRATGGLGYGNDGGRPQPIIYTRTTSDFRLLP